MTNKEKEVIYNDTRYYVITWEGGKIFTKFALIERRKKQIEKLFKGKEYHIRPCTYNEYFMNNVYILFKRLRARDNWYYSRGYRKIYRENGSYYFHDRRYDDD